MLGGSGYIYILNADGSNYPGWPIRMDASYSYGLAIGDINGDGKAEIVASILGLISGSDERVFAYRSNGSLVKSWALGNRGWYISLADLNQDKIDEIIVAEAGKMHAFTLSGELPGWPVSNSAFHADNDEAIADINGDGKLEIAVGGFDDKVYVYDYQGKILPGWPQAGGDYHSHFAIGDLDRDGKQEIVSYSKDSNIYARRYDGSLYPGWPKATNKNIEQGTYVSLSDVNQDNYPEVIISNAGNYWKTHVFNKDGTYLSGWPKIWYNDSDGKMGSAESAAISGDINGDAKPDIIISIDTGWVYAVNADGSMIEGFPKKISSAIRTSPALADLDKDGKIELLAGDSQGYLYVWDIDQPFSESTMEWSFNRNDEKNNGYYISSKPVIPPFISDVQKSDGTALSQSVPVVFSSNNDYILYQATDETGLDGATLKVEVTYPGLDTPLSFTPKWIAADNGFFNNNGNEKSFVGWFFPSAFLLPRNDYQIRFSVDDTDTPSNSFTTSWYNITVVKPPIISGVQKEGGQLLNQDTAVTFSASTDYIFYKVEDETGINGASLKVEVTYPGLSTPLSFTSKWIDGVNGFFNPNASDKLLVGWLLPSILLSPRNDYQIRFSVDDVDMPSNNFSTPWYKIAVTE